MKSREVRPFFVAGDIISFLLIGLVGMSNHDSGFTLGVIARTTLPFLLPWLVIAYVLGLYSPSRYSEPVGAAKAVMTAWIPSWAAGVLLRAIVWGRGFVPAFAIVMFFAGAIVLLTWRIVEVALRDHETTAEEH